MQFSTTFSTAEYNARHRFHIFYQDLFKTTVPSQAELHLTDSQLLKIYNLECSEFSLDIHQLDHLLYFGGYFPLDQEIVHCNIKETYIDKLKLDTQIFLLEICPEAYAARLQDLIRIRRAGSNNVNLFQNKVVPAHIKHFLSSWCITRKNVTNFNDLPKVRQRTQLKVIYDFYILYCEVNKILPLDKVQFNLFLGYCGLVFTKGYCQGHHGVRIALSICLPFSEEDRHFTISNNFARITLKANSYLLAGYAGIADDTICIQQIKKEAIINEQRAEQARQKKQPEEAKEIQGSADRIDTGYGEEEYQISTCEITAVEKTTTELLSKDASQDRYAENAEDEKDVAHSENINSDTTDNYKISYNGKQFDRGTNSSLTKEERIGFKALQDIIKIEKQLGNNLCLTDVEMVGKWLYEIDFHIVTSNFIQHIVTYYTKEGTA